MPRIIIESPSGGGELEVEQSAFDCGFFRGYVYVGDAGPVASTELAVFDTHVRDLVNDGASLTSDALRASYAPFWTAGEVVAASTVRVSPDGKLIVRNATGTTRGSYDTTEQAAWTASAGGGTVTGGTVTADGITDATTVGKALLRASDAPTARTAIGAGTSSFSGAYTDLTAKPTIPTVGAAGAGAAVALSSTDPTTTNARTATAHTHTSAQVSDSTAVGRSVLTAADAPTARTAIGAGTSSLALGTTSTTAKAGNWTPGIADLPAGSTLTVRQNSGDSSWPARPTTRQDLYVDWRFSVAGSTAPPAATTPGTTTDGTYPGDAIFGA